MLCLALIKKGLREKKLQTLLKQHNANFLDFTPHSNQKRDDKAGSVHSLSAQWITKKLISQPVISRWLHPSLYTVCETCRERQ